jgi:amino acid transporter
MTAQEPKLKRSLSLTMLVLYGLGTTVGAGIYVLVGKVAGIAGLFAPLAFLVASLLAAFTVFSFAEFSSRYPKSAGEAVYVFEGFGSKQLARLVGLMVVLSGLVSSAAISQGFVGYLHEFVVVPNWLAITILVAVMATLAIWGIAESVTVAAIATVIEIGGLVLVIWIGREHLAALPANISSLNPGFSGAHWYGIFAGAVLAFYAFIGFEDMVNVAEEVKNPRRTLPIAILTTLIVTTICYVLLVIVAISALPLEALVASDAPLALLFEETAGIPPTAITVIALIAVVNGALIQIIMGARVLYGLGKQGWLPAWVAKVHPKRHTPVVATLLIAAAVWFLAIAVPLVSLAKVTSILTLTIFAAINLSLIRVKMREPAGEGVFTFPLWMPAVGIIACLFFLSLGIYELAF